MVSLSLRQLYSSGATPDTCWMVSRCCRPENTSLLPGVRDSSVGIATGYELDCPGIESRSGASFSAPVQTGSGAYPASYTIGAVSCPGVKRPGRGVDHPPPI